MWIRKGWRTHVPRQVTMPLLVALLVGLTVMWPLLAQPVRGRIITDAHVVEKADATELHIEFSFPVRYMRHFPTDFGDSIQIQLRAVSISDIDQDLLARRESARLPETRLIPLLDVSYEGDMAGGPYLTVRFTEAVAFAVQQGVDFRSLTVIIPNQNTGSE